MQRVDLNLLQALDALLQEGSVRGAAERLGLSAPAMSHALSRLRGVTGDPLLVRAGQHLVPTPHAIAIRDQVNRTVEVGNSLLRNRPLDDLKKINRTFTIRATDSTTAVLGAGLVAHVREHAPNLQIRFSGRSEEDINALRDGTVDLDIGAVADVGPEICTESLLEDSFVCAVRSGHRLARVKMSVEDYAAADHVVPSRRGRSHGPIDKLLTESGLMRRVPVIVPDPLAAIALAAGSDFVATVPESVARWAERMMNVLIVKLPVAAPPITVYQSWHPRMSSDYAHQYLRDCMSKSALDL